MALLGMDILNLKWEQLVFNYCNVGRIKPL